MMFIKTVVIYQRFTDCISWLKIFTASFMLKKRITQEDSVLINGYWYTNVRANGYMHSKVDPCAVVIEISNGVGT